MNHNKEADDSLRMYSGLSGFCVALGLNGIGACELSRTCCFQTFLVLGDTFLSRLDV